MKKHNNNTLVLLLLFMFPSVHFFAQQEKEVIAEIKILKEDNFINIFPFAINKTQIFQDNLQYSMMTLKKTQRGNLSKSVQSGFFSLKPEEVSILSSSQFNEEPNTKIQIFLYIKRDSVLIAKDTLTFGNLDKNIPKTGYEKQLKSGELELTGLLLDNVVTQSGRLFVDRLNSKYRLNGNNFPFAVFVDEKPLFGGRNSEIKLQVNGEVISQFVIQPNEEYIDNVVNISYQKLADYYYEYRKLFSQE